jgi:uncharacterized caspase-like protein
MADNGSWHDYARSQAVLIGTWDYDRLPPVPAAKNSLERMTGTLTGPLCGWPRERLEVFGNLPRPDNLPDRLMELFEGVADIALFYFVGHGQLHNDELALALRESPEAGPRRLTTGLAFADVRAALRECDAQTKIVILDCCFAGHATEPQYALAPPTADVVDLTMGTGAFTMAASGKYRTAWFEPDTAVGPQTYFTKYLIDTIEHGIAEHPGDLSLGGIFEAAAEALGRDHKPEPTRSVRHDAARFAFARNIAAPGPASAQTGQAHTRFPDPAKSRIVLIGTPIYTNHDLPDIPQLAENLASLAAVFTDPWLAGFPAENCVTVPQDADLAQVGDALVQAAQEAEDLLLLYYTGHGLIGARGRNLYLSLAGTRPDRLAFTALPFDTVRETCMDSQALNRVVILDSAFSGRVIADSMAANETLDQVEIAGTYTLTSSPANTAAIALSGEPHTAFTGRLVEAMRSGIPDAGEFLTLGDIYRHLSFRLSAEGLPMPQQRGTQTADRLKLVRNRQHLANFSFRPPGRRVTTIAGLPEELRVGLASSYPRIRIATLQELAGWLRDADPSRVQTARTALEDIAANDILMVANVARDILEH